MRSCYFDHNATTPIRSEALRAMVAHLEGDAANPSSRHRPGRAAEDARETARQQLATATGCTPEQVIFTSGGTEADNLALRGVARAHPGGHVVTSATEHEAILQTCEELAPAGWEITVLPVNQEGVVDAAAVERALRPETCLVTLMAANNETGALAPIAEIGALCRARGVLFHTDAVQAFGKIPFDFGAANVDLASLSSHKIGGPQGVGALLRRPGMALAARQTGGAQERGIRPGTENLPGIVGFGKAAEMAAGSLAAESRRLAGLRDQLEAGIRERFPTIQVNSGNTARLPNTSNITFPEVDGESLMIALDIAGVAVSTGAACAAGVSDPSHVLLAMGCTRAEAASSLRFSLGLTTDEAEVREVLEILSAVVPRVRQAGRNA